MLKAKSYPFLIRIKGHLFFQKRCWNSARPKIYPDLFEKHSKTDTNWQCVCGKINPIDEPKCSHCGRSMNAIQSPAIDKIYEKLQAMKSAKEIYNYLKQQTEFGLVIPQDRLEEMKKLSFAERAYGNMKEDTMRVVDIIFDSDF